MVFGEFDSGMPLYIYSGRTALEELSALHNYPVTVIRYLTLFLNERTESFHLIK